MFKTLTVVDRGTSIRLYIAVALMTPARHEWWLVVIAAYAVAFYVANRRMRRESAL